MVLIVSYYCCVKIILQYGFMSYAYALFDNTAFCSIFAAK